jgi:hypothetical protein
MFQFRLQFHRVKIIETSPPVNLSNRTEELIYRRNAEPITHHHKKEEPNMSHVPGELIPIIAIIMSILAAIAAMYFNYQRQKQEQETIRQAVEKGVELPADLFNRHNGRYSRSHPLRRGIFWTALGISLFVALYINEGLKNAIWGLIPFAIGIGYLFYYKLLPQNGEKKQTL